jgi:predicted AlkP superfamily pyrophosphatase or phosphodiesterase
MSGFRISAVRRILTLVLALLCAGWTLLAQPALPPILILISLDGWRWDYLDRANAPNLKALAARGVRAEGLIPAFPTLTFPNHYTIVTGWLPDRHGIVSNTMTDRSIAPQRFTMSSATAKDARWWGGEPIWTTAIRQGRKSASMFWPGSEAIHPTHWKPYDDAVPNVERVRQVLDWLALPEPNRPTFVTLYFSDVDSASHDAGPDSAEALAAASRLDDMVGRLVTGLGAGSLIERTTIAVVSDHGLAETSRDRLIFLDDYITRSEAEIVDAGAMLSLNPAASTTVDALYAKLAGKHPALSVYRKAQLPAWLRYGAHPRVPAIVGLVERGWLVTWRDSAAKAWAQRAVGGAHGYDPRYRDMHGLFVAAGPRVRRGYVGPSIQNVHLYEFMCEVLGLRAATNDGDRAQTANFIAR